MRARLRAPGGASTITLPDDATVSDLITQITEKTSLSSFDVKYGYPPQPLLLEQYESSQALNKLGIKLEGEQLTISARDPPQEPIPAPAQKDVQDPAGLASLKAHKPISLKKKKNMEEEVPELPMPSRGATLGMSPNGLAWSQYAHIS
jgi:ubiquitin thioesterase OTU1